MGCNVVKKSASRRPGERQEIAPGDRHDVGHGPRQAIALTRQAEAYRCGDGRRHAASFPSATSLLRDRPRPRFGFAAVSVPSSIVVLWPVRLRNTSSRLGSRRARPGDGDLRGVERAEHVRSGLGAVGDGELDDEVLDDGRFFRERCEQRDRLVQCIPVAQRHGDHRRPQVGLELCRRPLGDDAPVVDHHDVAGQSVGLFEVLRRQQDRGALADQVLDGHPEGLAALGVQARRRLVEEQDRRIGHQCGGQVQASAHAAGIGLEHAVAGTGQAEVLEQLVGPARRHLAAQVGEAPHHVDVLPAGQVLVHRGVLPGEPDGAADRVGLGDHVVAEHRGAPGVGAEDGGEDAHDGGLARTVRAEQTEHRAGLHLERDAVEGPHVAAGEDLHEVVGLDGESGVRRMSHELRNLVIKLLTCQDNGHERSWPSSCGARSWGTSARPATSMSDWRRS